MAIFIHPTSFVDTNSQIGEGSKIWHFCHILDGVVIEKNCSFGQNCVVGRNVKIAQGCKIQNNVSIYEGVECEENVFIGPSVVFTNIINPRAFISRKNEFKKTLLKKGCSIGANATIVCGIQIGEYAFVGAGAVVRKDVKPYALVVGVPAKEIGWIDRGGNTMKFDASNKAIDSYDGTRYKLVNQKVIIDED